ncbi:MAG TPA: glycoside hydrolase family 3 N-terminal domain-containing protein [Polyangia bacterium]|nr:glycoside hydrolase family 3 N-terminal domain-containing protein [Polyangia bacterium]
MSADPFDGSKKPPAAPTRRTFLGAAAATALGPAACVGPRPGATPQPSAADVPAARKAGLPAPDVEALLGQMTLDEKIGQMTQADKNALKDGREIHELFMGSVLSGADSLPKPNTPDTWATMTDRFQSQALSTRLGIPIFYGVDAVHGDGDVKGSVLFPHQIGMGATRNPDIVQRAARVTAREVAGTGARWTFGPCIAVARDERWGRTYESYGESPELAELLGPAAVRGFQDADDGSGILASAKHFLGDGGTFGGKDQGDTRVSLEELRKIHLPGYVACIKAGVGSVMVSYSSWNGAPMHGNKMLITDVLKGELGFTGFVVTDWAAIDKMSKDYKQDVEVAINAGIDMVMVPNRYREFVADMKELVAAGRISLARIDDAVRRILKQKARFKLWERPFTDPALTAQIGSAEHRAVARQAVQQSLVVLKNDKNVLPIKSGARVHLCGFRADDMGVQCGGWSVGWRGHRGAITPGTTIRQGFEQVLGAGRVDFSKDAAGAEKADLVVVVVGEDPYAEGSGDRTKLELGPEDRALIEAAKKSGKPLVIVLLSGRPLILGDVVDSASALVAAWLPGTEGAGIADLLAGAVKPTGKLPCSWPRDMAQIPINVGDPNYTPLFEYGFGLSW